jgi:hypothetical protein
MGAFSAARQLFGTWSLVDALGEEKANRHSKLPRDSIAPEHHVQSSSGRRACSLALGKDVKSGIAQG